MFPNLGPSLAAMFEFLPLLHHAGVVSSQILFFVSENTCVEFNQRDVLRQAVAKSRQAGQAGLRLRSIRLIIDSPWLFRNLDGCLIEGEHATQQPSARTTLDTSNPALAVAC